MRAFVFTDRALEGQAGRFVWLSIDTEKERNAAFLERYPIEAYPTLLVIDPARERAALRWVGGATVERLVRILDDGARAVLGEVRGADAVLAKADRLLGRGRKEKAVSAYRRALARAPDDWSARERAVESLILVLAMTDRNRECVETASSLLPEAGTQHFANVAALGLECAMGLESPGTEIARFESAVGSAARDSRIEMPADDRSSLYGAIVRARRDAGDEPGAKAVASEWLAFLEEEVARAPGPLARAVYDSHRLSAAIAIGEPARAIPALEQSERDLPDDYNPPARLAVAYTEAGRYDEALAAADRALRLVYGPRKLRVYWTRADILEKTGEQEAARETLREALRYAETLPGAQVSERRLEALERRLAELGP